MKIILAEVFVLVALFCCKNDFISTPLVLNKPIELRYGEISKNADYNISNCPWFRSKWFQVSNWHGMYLGRQCRGKVYLFLRKQYTAFCTKYAYLIPYRYPDWRLPHQTQYADPISWSRSCYQTSGLQGGNSDYQIIVSFKSLLKLDFRSWQGLNMGRV